MRFSKEWTIKAVALTVWVVILVFAGIAFAQHRRYKEPVVLGPGVTEVKTLGDYYAPIKGTPNDCNVYILDSGNPGGALVILGTSSFNTSIIP